MTVYVVCRDNAPSETFGAVAVFSSLMAAECYAREMAHNTAYLWTIRAGTMELDPAKEIVFSL